MISLLVSSDIMHRFAFLSQDLVFKDAARCYIGVAKVPGCWQSPSAAQLLQSALTLNFPDLGPISPGISDMTEGLAVRQLAKLKGAGAVAGTI